MSNMPIFENPCGAYSRYEITKHIPLSRLEEICQAERDGRCVVLPCKVGDTVYVMSQVFDWQSTRCEIGTRTIDRIAGNSLNPCWVESTHPYPLHFHPSEFGRTVFLTREEAEAALKGEAPNE